MKSSKQKIIVAGGAGYIGSQVVLDLKQAGYVPIVVDNFTMGNRDIAERLGVELCEGDLGDEKFIAEVFKQHNPLAVMHFAAHAMVGESVTDPEKYYLNNVAMTLNLLSEMRKARVTRFIFSSTCATYGTPDQVPINEVTRQEPINPYGFSKLVIERALQDYAKAYGLQSVIFRYFNAAGAHPDGLIGERHDPETHLIPLAIAAVLGHGPELKVFGDDYDTPDGTCIRDYIHVADISQAHILGLEHLMRGGATDIFNIGTESGNSVKQVISAIEAVSGKKVPYTVTARRAGDPARLIADATKLKRVLGWKPRFTELSDIVGSAWRWHQKDWQD